MIRNNRFSLLHFLMLIFALTSAALVMAVPAASEAPYRTIKVRSVEVGGSNTPVKPVKSVAVVDVGQAILELAEKLEAGTQKTIEQLERLGFKDALSETLQQDKGRPHRFSSYSIIQHLYHRAELAAPGKGGAQFLRILFDDISKKSAQFATNPNLAWLKDVEFDQLEAAPRSSSRFAWFSDTSGPEELGEVKQPIKMASLSEIPANAATQQFSGAVIDAIDELAKGYAEPHAGKLKQILVRKLKLGSVHAVDAALLDSGGVKQGLAKMFGEQRPPPSLEKAILDIMSEVQGGSAASSISPETLDVMKRLSHSDALPANLKAYGQIEDALPSRAKQRQLAASVGQPGKISQSVAEKQIAVLDRLAPSTGSVANVADSAITRPPPASLTRLAAKLQVPNGAMFSQKYQRYTNNAFRGVSRTYRTAIRLPTLARGIAVGADVDVQISAKPTSAIWMPNDQDPQFGRLYVELPDQSLIAVSRVLFADSFYSAAAFLQDQDEDNANVRDGELSILMSMDIEPMVSESTQSYVNERRDEMSERVTQLDAERQDLELSSDRLAIEAELERYSQKAAANGNRLNSKDYRRYKKLIERHNRFVNQINRLVDERNRVAKEINQLQDQIPRGVVLHPAIRGREMAWSTTRIDFWFNDLPGLSREAQQMNGGRERPENFVKLNISQASTWQFYERDRVLVLNDIGGNVAEFQLTASPGAAAQQSYFSVSMFAIKKSIDLGGIYLPGQPNITRLPELERQIQPMLDWLSLNHHDFIRLNDFSEAVALIGWLQQKGVTLTIFDADGLPGPIATPDRVFLSKGPWLDNGALGEFSEDNPAVPPRKYAKDTSCEAGKRSVTNISPRDKDGGLVIRPEPDYSGDRISVIPRNAKGVCVHTCKQVGSKKKKNSKWCRVSYHGNSGWVNARFLDLE